MIRSCVSKIIGHLRRLIGRLTADAQARTEIDALYRFLYFIVHDPDNAPDLASFQTRHAFGFQWDTLPEGQLMLSDPWFRENVTRILCEQELMLPANWFPGKEVLDCGCGGGRWSYGLAKLGANVTAVDVNASAIQATKEALEPFSVDKTFIQSPLESLSENLPSERRFDLVFSWGVLHHCRSFTGSLRQISSYVKDGGLLHLFLYGNEPQGFERELDLFKQRVYYNSLPTWGEREEFLLLKAGGNREKMNKRHDKLAPLINRRLEFPYVRDLLLDLGFSKVELTKEQEPSWSEAKETGRTRNLFIRAIKGNASELEKVLLPNAKPSYWFWRYSRPDLAGRILPSHSETV